MNDKEQIKKYEIAFLNKSFQTNQINFEESIHDDFKEIGKSGKVYKKKDIIDYLNNTDNDKNIELIDFIYTYINEDTILVNYISLEKDNNLNIFRTSVWVKKNSNWKIIFHQGTIII